MSLEEQEVGGSYDHLTGTASMPKASILQSAILHSPKDVEALGATSPLDLLSTVPWEATTLSGDFPYSFRRSLAGSRSEIEISMPPKPILLRNSRSLEDVPHLSLT